MTLEPLVESQISGIPPIRSMRITNRLTTKFLYFTALRRKAAQEGSSRRFLFDVLSGHPIQSMNGNTHIDDYVREAFMVDDDTLVEIYRNALLQSNIVVGQSQKDYKPPRRRLGAFITEHPHYVAELVAKAGYYAPQVTEMIYQRNIRTYMDQFDRVLDNLRLYLGDLLREESDHDPARYDYVIKVMNELSKAYRSLNYFASQFDSETSELGSHIESLKSTLIGMKRDEKPETVKIEKLQEYFREITLSLTNVLSDLEKKEPQYKSARVNSSSAEKFDIGILLGLFHDHPEEKFIDLYQRDGRGLLPPAIREKIVGEKLLPRSLFDEPLSRIGLPYDKVLRQFYLGLMLVTQWDVQDYYEYLGKIVKKGRELALEKRTDDELFKAGEMTRQTYIATWNVKMADGISNDDLDDSNNIARLRAIYRYAMRERNGNNNSNGVLGSIRNIVNAAYVKSRGLRYSFLRLMHQDFIFSGAEKLQRVYKNTCFIDDVNAVINLGLYSLQSLILQNWLTQKVDERTAKEGSTLRALNRSEFNKYKIFFADDQSNEADRQFYLRNPDTLYDDLFLIYLDFTDHINKQVKEKPSHEELHAAYAKSSKKGYTTLRELTAMIRTEGHGDGNYTQDDINYLVMLSKFVFDDIISGYYDVRIRKGPRRANGNGKPKGVILEEQLTEDKERQYVHFTALQGLIRHRYFPQIFMTHDKFEFDWLSRQRENERVLAD